MRQRSPPRIIDLDPVLAMPEDRAALIDDIRSLLSGEAGAAAIERVEDILTAGYAHAMALEADHIRLERRLARMARGLDGRASGDAAELDRLTVQLGAVETDLAHLRALLESLRDRARELRAAAA